MSRGRGRGRGGGMGGGQSQAPMGAVTYKELTELSRDQPKLYPDPDTHPNTDRPSPWEVLIADYQLAYLDRQRHSPYWLRQSQKKAKELPRYTDRYRPENEDSAGPQLRDAPLQRETLPQELAKAFFEGEIRRAKIEKAKAKKKNIDWDAFEQTDKNAPDAEDGMGGDAEEDEQLGDYEDEEEDDYNDNYFDNGEDDDDGGDVGGDGGGDEAEF